MLRLQVCAGVLAASDAAGGRELRIQIQIRLELPGRAALRIGRAGMGQGVAQWIAGRSPETAVGAAVQQFIEFVQALDIRGRALSGTACLRQLVQPANHQFGTDAAGRAQTAALVGKEAGKVPGDFEQIAALVEDYKSPCAGQVFKGNPAVKVRRGYATS